MSHPNTEQLRNEAQKLLAEYKDKTLTNRDRLAIPGQEMPTLDPVERRSSMGEVATGYSEEQALVESLRCLQCKTAPCVDGCPVRVPIPQFIQALLDEGPKAAVDIIKTNNLLPAICGRVCPQESQCQEKCTVGKSLKDPLKSVNIGRLERYVADFERTNNLATPAGIKPDTGKSVAVIGSGPAGLTAAADLRREGHRVVLFEAFHKAGGVMMYGIPEFRLPKEIVQKEINALRDMGVEIRTNYLVGRTRKLQDLMKEDGFDAVFIGSGAGLPKFMHIPGENLVGVFSANEYLTRSNLMKAYDPAVAATPMYQAKRVAVLGGGNVAMDAARTAVRLGAEEVTIIYRRSLEEMPARKEEVLHAQEEGIIFRILSNPEEIIGNEQGRVTSLRCLAYELGEPDASGRRSPKAVPGSDFIIEADAVIVSIGNDSNPLIGQTTPELTLTKRGNIVVDEQNRTSMKGVYAGGDIVLGAATVILAMGEGRRAAAAISADLG